jgi:uncharacterized protein YecT (DUF1311 family)
LAVALREYRKRLAPADATMLDATQQAWTPFRDRWCSFLAHGSEEGSIYPFTIALCRLDLTQQRLKQLRYLATCVEGDSMCPAPTSSLR